MTCLHPNAVVRPYVGTTESYHYCPVCFEAWEGEETPAKKALLTAAAETDPGEQDEP